MQLHKPMCTVGELVWRDSSQIGKFLTSLVPQSYIFDYIISSITIGKLMDEAADYAVAPTNRVSCSKTQLV